MGRGIDGITWYPWFQARSERVFTAEIREHIAETALSSPIGLIGMTQWSVPKLRQYLIEQKIIAHISIRWLNGADQIGPRTCYRVVHPSLPTASPPLGVLKARRTSGLIFSLMKRTQPSAMEKVAPPLRGGPPNPRGDVLMPVAGSRQLTG
jgi:hypothetical protein